MKDIHLSEALPFAGRLMAAGEVRLWVDQMGAGPPLLMVPGLGAGSWLWTPVREALSRRFTLVMPELRGGPRSEAPDAPYTVRGFARDMAAVLDALGIARAHVLGASLGGFVAQYLAAEHPARVDRLVLVATAPGGQNQIGPSGEVLARTIRPRGRTRRERLEDAYALSFTDAFRDARPDALEAITAWRLQHPQSEAAYYRQLLAGNAYDGAAHSARVLAPTLVCAGRDDAVVPPTNADALVRLIPNARSALFPGRHLFFFETPATFGETVARFLTSPDSDAPETTPVRPVETDA